MRNTIAGFALALLASLSNLHAEPAPVLYELFTSQGCSSCPPADDLLIALAADPALAGRLIPLAFHVDYWNHLGWPDPFSRPEWTTRQRAYARSLPSDSVYTPQLVLNGHRHLVGSRRRDVLAALAEESKLPTLPLSMKVEFREAPPALLARIPVPPLPTLPSRALAALTVSNLSTEVPDGENAGATLASGAVVMALQTLGAPGPAGWEVTFPLRPDWPRAALHLVAWVQSEANGRVLAAGRAPVPEQARSPGSWGIPTTGGVAMVTIGVQFKTRAGCEGEFQAASRELLESIRGLGGHQGSRMLRDIDEPGTFVLLSDWDARDEFEGFVSSEAFHELVLEQEPELLREQPSHRTYADHHQPPRALALRRPTQLLVM